MNKLFLIFAAIAGAAAVLAGALLSHQLKSRMPEHALEVFETAVRYQFYHVFALLAAGILSDDSWWMDQHRRQLFYCRYPVIQRITVYHFRFDYCIRNGSIYFGHPDAPGRFGIYFGMDIFSDFYIKRQKFLIMFYLTKHSISA